MVVGAADYVADARRFAFRPRCRGIGVRNRETPTPSERRGNYFSCASAKRPFAARTASGEQATCTATPPMPSSRLPAATRRRPAAGTAGAAGNHIQAKRHARLPTASIKQPSSAEISSWVPPPVSSVTHWPSTERHDRITPATPATRAHIGMNVAVASPRLRCAATHCGGHEILPVPVAAPTAGARDRFRSASRVPVIATSSSSYSRVRGAHAAD
jgi:hypothetical protein